MRQLNVCVLVAILTSLAACRPAPSNTNQTVYSTALGDESSSSSAKSIEDVRSKDSLISESGEIAAHPGRAVRDNFTLTIWQGASPVASFKDTYSGCGDDSCGQAVYAGVFRLRDPASGRLTDYDHVTIVYSEDSFEYLVDSDGRLYFAGTYNALISPNGSFMASTDHNINGDGNLTILDWAQKSVIKFDAAKDVRVYGNYCSGETWTARNSLIALCKTLSHSYVSRVEITRRSDGRWRMDEQVRFSIDDAEDGDFDALKLRPGAKGIKPDVPTVLYGKISSPVELHGYRRLKGS